MNYRTYSAPRRKLSVTGALRSVVQVSCLFVATTCLLASDTVVYPDGISLANDLEAEDPPLSLRDDISLALRQPDAYVDDVYDPDVTEAFFQQQAPLTPQTSATPAAPPLPNSAQSLVTSLFGSWGVPRSILAGSVLGIPSSSDVVLNPQSQVRVSTDVGNLLGKSPSVLGVGVQHRNPIVTDPRERGSRVGALAASGSYWVPARIDLDTMLSKIDSRIVEDTVVIKGPYTALYGPGFEFYDVTLQPAPRYGSKFENHGSTSFDYKTNGENWYGRQSFWGGQSDWGYRVSYGHRTGNDYESGNDTQFPTSFNSRDWDVALGADLTEAEHVDVEYLRLDQTDVELPGQAFDINFLVTDGYEVIYRSDHPRYFDHVETRTWYNRTRFEGDNQKPGKRKQFPIFDFLAFDAFTDVDSMSTGFRSMGNWESCNGGRLIVGTDLRFVKQELNEIASGIGFSNANSPIPRSYISNPGLFFETNTPDDNPLVLRFGGRIDFVLTNIDENAASLASVTPQGLPYAAVVGSDQFDQSDVLASVFATSDWKIDDCSSLELCFGFGQRPPNLTERYAAEPFMFLLQNGLNTITGDPTLDPERIWQMDLTYRYNAPNVRSGVTGFFALAHNYITFENLSVILGPPAGNPIQENLKYVNTSLATFSGVEWYAETDASRNITPFATLKYVEGTDNSRQGSFATIEAAPGMPSTRDPTRPRGFYSGVAGGPSEPLPGILPLEARVGVRFHPSRRTAQRYQPGDDDFYKYDNRTIRDPGSSPDRDDSVHTASWNQQSPSQSQPNASQSRINPSSMANRGNSYGGGRSLAQQQDPWGIELSARIVDNQNRVATSLLETTSPGFTVWDIRTFFRPRNNVLLVSGVENFTDKNYREHLDFHSLDGVSVFQPGVNFYAGGEVDY